MTIFNRAGTLALAVAAMLLAGCAAGPVGNRAVPEPAKPVELERYMGRWYELARYENRFERGCEGVTADYSLRPDGTVDVVNTCREGSPGGEASAADGHATVVPDSNGAKLKVSFFWPFYGDYWVLDRSQDYEWAIVGEPEGRFFWILSRDPTPGQAVLDQHLQRARELGYDMSLVRITRQPPT
ncbi:MAG TPA: lipocalin family protein [Geminicoccus sp.]|jgi:apolipoprotein D and lipocalin family protein|uniref:lipocalin family protein n=1 Tax=Geminicoccus sp. TaxID=2024832 RepID=UPI002E33458F|nr:lipocalin family protein [Geminicoccus sp.]HEX2529660.1 lipocalin family protein [Geminicoccus sp.]